MTRTSHRCVFFDDGGPEYLCVCGARAIAVPDPSGDGTVLVEVDVEVASVTVARTGARTDLAISA